MMLLLLSLFLALPAMGAEDMVIDVCPVNSTQRLYKQPKGPFAVMVFCEDALATHIAVVYYDNMASPADGKWEIANRFWQEGKWGSDVTDFAWDPSGAYLFVATNMVYGTGAVYQLDLRNRLAKRLYPDSLQQRLCHPKEGFAISALRRFSLRKRQSS